MCFRESGAKGADRKDVDHVVDMVDSAATAADAHANSGADCGAKMDSGADVGANVGADTGTTNDLGPQAATPVQAVTPGPQLVDGLSLWRNEVAGAPPVSVPVIRIDESDRIFIFFTTSIARVGMHYVNAEEIRGYTQCHGESCLLCQIGRSKDTRDLVPAYDLVDREVGVLLVSPNLRPHALRPQLQPILERVGRGEPPFLVTVRKAGLANFVVTTLPLPEGGDNGSRTIASFCDRLKSGDIELTAAIQSLPNSILADIPDIATVMRARGITPA